MNTIICSECGYEYPENFPHCAECGNPTPSKIKIRTNSTNCSSCGAPIGETRLCEWCGCAHVLQQPYGEQKTVIVNNITNNVESNDGSSTGTVVAAGLLGGIIGSIFD